MHKFKEELNQTLVVILPNNGGFFALNCCPEFFIYGRIECPWELILRPRSKEFSDEHDFVSVLTSVIRQRARKGNTRIFVDKFWRWMETLPFAFWLNFIVTCHFIALESYVIENHFERTSLSFSFYVNPSSIEQVHDFPGALILYKYVVFETVDV